MYGRYPEELTYAHMFSPAPTFFFLIFVLVLVGAGKQFVYLLLDLQLS